MTRLKFILTAVTFCLVSNAALYTVMKHEHRPKTITKTVFVETRVAYCKALPDFTKRAKKMPQYFAAAIPATALRQPREL